MLICAACSAADLDTAGQVADSGSFGCCTCYSADRSLPAAASHAAACSADCIGCGTGRIAAAAACCFVYFADTSDYSFENCSQQVMAEESCPSLNRERRGEVRQTSSYTPCSTLFTCEQL